MRLVKKLPDKPCKNSLAVPFSITIFKKCIKFRIDTALIKHLHFFDLQCLIIQFEIQEIREYLENEEKKKLQKRGIKDVKQISGAEAIKFLGR